MLTDARDAKVIADQSRMRAGLPALRPGEEVIAELRMLTGRRADLVADRTRTINRLRQQLTAVRPALERVAGIAIQRGWSILLTCYQRPKAIRRAGVDRLTQLLVGAGVRNAAAIAEAAVAAATSQTVRLPGQDVAAELVAALAKEVIDLDARITATDTAVGERSRRHRLANVIVSMPGLGYRLGAELLAASGDLDLIASADQLAVYAGLAPVADDSGKRTGRLHTPSRYNRRLRRMMCMSGLTSMRCRPESRAYYDRKRAEGKRPVQAVVCLARRRTNVLWKLMRDNRTVVVMCASRQQAEAALERLRALLADLGLEPKEAKTRIVHLEEAGEGLDFLGFHHWWVRSPGWRGKRGSTFLARWPADKAMQRARDRIRELTVRSRLLLSVETVVQDINRFLPGWAAYFRYGHSTGRFGKIRSYALERLALFIGKRHKRGRGFGWRVVIRLSPNQYGLISLDGIVVAPRANKPWRERPNAGGERRR